MQAVPKQSKKCEAPEYDGFKDVLAVPLKDRVGMTEGHRLKPDEPGDNLLWSWCVHGRLIRLEDGREARLRLPSFIAPGGRRFTTIDAFRWWTETLDHHGRFKFRE